MSRRRKRTNKERSSHEDQTSDHHRIYGEANVYGVTGRIMWDTWWTAQGMFLSGKMDLGPVTTHHFDLKDYYGEAFPLAESAATEKIVFKN
jgi:threonine 3-dehydrogenase